MTVALKNVDYQFLDVLKSLIKLRNNIELFQVDDNFIENENFGEIPNELTAKVLKESENENEDLDEFSIKVDKSCIKPAELPKEKFVDLIGKIELDGDYIKAMREECLL